ncbi:hypothetical protein NPIL_474741 [Nephila pilipes]|uniref:Uncharacterized protein n=1 Tax=Nephila pilipes TaxID=299642 RepID=A0A8X6U0P5_NEPPI|nr:hypothetical protein NPIL_474741 [Nephila pilipes]
MRSENKLLGKVLGPQEGERNSAMVLAILSWSSMVSFIPVDGLSNSLTSLTIVADQMHSYMTILILRILAFFKKVMSHNVKICHASFEEHEEEF